MNPGFRDVLRRVLLVVGFGVAFGFVMFLIEPRYGMGYAVLLLLVLILLLVRAYATGYRYRCANCGNIFKVPLLVDFLTFSGMGRNADGTYHTWKSLTCPKCRQRTRAVAIKVRHGESAAADGDRYRSRGADDAPAAPQAKPRSTKPRAARKRK